MQWLWRIVHTTGDKLRSRRTIHAQQIRDTTTRQIQLPFYKVNSENISVGLAKEKNFISCFKPKLNRLRRDV